MDFVSEEAAAAGRNAAAYVKAGGLKKKLGWEILLKPGQGVRYTVPEIIHPAYMNETLRFRVSNVYKNCYISVFFDSERVHHRKRQIAAPGEMEEVKLVKEELLKYPDLKQITVMIEEG